MRRRRCPHCAESIQADARVCRWCGRDLEAADQAQVPSGSRRRARSDAAIGWALAAMLAVAAAGGLGYAWTTERDRVSDLEATLAGAESQADENAAAAAEVVELQDQVEDLEGRLDVATTAGLALSDSLEAQLRSARRRARTTVACVDQLVQAYNRSTILTFTREFQAALIGGSCSPLGYTFS